MFITYTFLPDYVWLKTTARNKCSIFFLNSKQESAVFTRNIWGIGIPLQKPLNTKSTICSILLTTFRKLDAWSSEETLASTLRIPKTGSKNRYTKSSNGIWVKTASYCSGYIAQCSTAEVHLLCFANRRVRLILFLILVILKNLILLMLTFTKCCILQCSFYVYISRCFV